MCGVTGAADEDSFSGRSASESECTPTSTNPPSETESEVTETTKGDKTVQGSGEDCVATDKVVGNEEETGPSPATEPPKEPPREEQASESPYASDVEPPLLNGLLEIHSKPTTEHILVAE